jgi:hypothetical protein
LVLPIPIFAEQCRAVWHLTIRNEQPLTQRIDSINRFLAILEIISGVPLGEQLLDALQPTPSRRCYRSYTSSDTTTVRLIIHPRCYTGDYYSQCPLGLLLDRHEIIFGEDAIIKTQQQLEQDNVLTGFSQILCLVDFLIALYKLHPESLGSIRNYYLFCHHHAAKT